MHVFDMPYSIRVYILKLQINKPFLLSHLSLQSVKDTYKYTCLTNNLPFPTSPVLTFLCSREKHRVNG